MWRVCNFVAFVVTTSSILENTGTTMTFVEPIYFLSQPLELARLIKH